MTLLQTDFLPNKSETFQALRFMMQEMSLQTGRVNAGDYKVTQHSTPNMTVDVAAGGAWIIGTTATRQGIYHQVNDALVNVGNFANSDPTNPRLDQVILVVNDSSIAGGSDNPQFAIVQGAATAGATLDNRSGAVADATINTTYRNSWVRWADVLIPAGSSSILNANIRDRGPFARGAYRRLIRTSGSYTIATSSTTVIDASNLSPRIECSGVPVKLRLRGSHNGAPTMMRYRFLQDGADVDGGTQSDFAIAGGPNYDVNAFWETIPTAGSHIFAPAWGISTGTGTATLYGTAGAPLLLIVEELIRQNAENT